MSAVLSPTTLTNLTPVGVSVGAVPALSVLNSTNATLSILFGPLLVGTVGPNATLWFTGLEQQASFTNWVVITPTFPGTPVGTTCTITTYGTATDVYPSIGVGDTGYLFPRPGGGLANPPGFSIAGQNLLNVLAFGATGDGVHDDSAPIANAMAAAAVSNRALYWPLGTYVSTTQTAAAHVYHRGEGQGVTIVKLKNGTNGDLFTAFASSINLSGVAGSGPSTCIYAFGFQDMTLDGNYSNQTAGPSYPLRFYGYGYILQNLDIRNGYSGGVLCDYYGPFPSSGGFVPADETLTNNERFESTWINVRSYNNLGTTTAIGIECGGPHDTRWTNVLSYNNNSHSIHCAPNFGGLQATGCHAWLSGHSDVNSCTWLQEASLYASGCEAEGSPQAQLVILSQTVVWVGGSVFAGGAAGLGIQIGQNAGLTPFTNSTKQSAGLTTAVAVSSYIVETLIQNITHASGGLALTNDAGGVLILRIVAASGTNTIYTGTVAAKTSLLFNAQGYNNPPQQLWLLGGSSQGGPLGYGQAAVSDPGNGGTIATTGPNVIPLNPAASETGVILGSGQFSGQQIMLINRSGANTITFAASGTSHVADGVSDVLAVNTSRTYVWDSGQALWYPSK